MLTGVLRQFGAKLRRTPGSSLVTPGLYIISKCKLYYFPGLNTILTNSQYTSNMHANKQLSMHITSVLYINSDNWSLN